MADKRSGAPDRDAFGPNMKWTEEARAKRAAVAVKAQATRARKRLVAEAQRARG